MKKMFIIVCASLFAACNNSTDSKETKETKEAATEPATTEKIDYAYLPTGHGPDNWDRGDQKNIAIVLKSLKGYETGNIEEALAGFADSVWWSSDYFDQQISKDSLRAMFTDGWKDLASVKIVMSDYESVISKDKKDEWVTLWYKQIVTNKKGKIDSMSVVNDVKIENGKITVLDEKTRKFPLPKK